MLKTVLRYCLEGAGVSTLMGTTLMLALGLPLGIIDVYGPMAFFTGVACGLVCGVGALNLSDNI